MSTTTSSSSHLFDSYRAVGLVCTTGSTVHRAGDAKTFSLCGVGRSFVAYDAHRLRVALPSKPVPCAQDVSLVVSGGGDVAYVAAGKRLFEFKRADLRAEFEGGHECEVVQILAFGNDVLLSLDAGGVLISWDCKSKTESDSPRCELGASFKPTFLMHPKTYLNKVLVGGAAGLMQLWNVRTGALIHSFDMSELKADKTRPAVTIECAEQSPAVDVVCLGTSDGRVILKNLRFDKTIFVLKHESKAKVQCLTFLEYDQVSLLASATSKGEIALWNLEEKRILHTLQTSSSSLSLHFLPGESLLLQTGSDNSLRLWEMDSASFHLNLLKSREGHATPPTKIRFHPEGSTIATLSSGSDGRALQILTCSSASSLSSSAALRSFHCALDHQSKELSQTVLGNKHLTPITSIFASEAREKDWFNIVSTHAGVADARVWNFENNKLGEGVLNMRSKGYGSSLVMAGKRKRGGNDSDVQSPATACTISGCGSFAFVGSASGIVSKYNLQSGRFISTFPKQLWVEGNTKRVKRLSKPKLAPAGSAAATTGEVENTAASLARDETHRHQGTVVGVCLDGLDERLFTAGTDGTILVWDSTTSHLIERVDLNQNSETNVGITQMIRSRDGGLVAFVGDDFSVGIMDSVTWKIVRRFPQAHRSRITDLCFTPDSKWIVTASMDSSIRVFDLPSGRCVDWMRFDSPPVSVSFSPSNEYLITAHIDCLAACMWANRVHFGSAKPEKIVKVPVGLTLPHEPGAVEEEGDVVEQVEKQATRPRSSSAASSSGHEAAQASVAPTNDVYGTVVLAEDSLTTSSRWFTLSHLELIKERNRPIRPAEKPQAAPFFLPSSAQELDALSATKPVEGMSKIMSSKSLEEGSVMTSMGMPSSMSSKLEEVVLTAKRMKQIKSKDADVEEAAVHRLMVERAALFKDFASGLSTISPSAVDYEIRSISFGPEDEEGSRALLAWLDWISIELKAGSRFELVQAVLGRVIHLHADSLRERPELKKTLVYVSEEQKRCWKQLWGKMQKCLCNVEMLCGMR